MGSLTEEDFKAWLTPRQAIADLAGLGADHTIMTAINERVAANLLSVAAGRIQEKLAEPVLRSLVASTLWALDPPGMHHDLWGRGDITLRIRRSHNVPREIHLFGVRFNPIGIEQIRVDAGISTAPEATASPPPSPIATTPMKPLPGAEIDRFARLYLGLWGDGAKEMKALDAIRASYPEHQIGRDPFLAKFRELRGPGKRGKPTNRGQ